MKLYTALGLLSLLFIGTVQEAPAADAVAVEPTEAESAAVVIDGVQADEVGETGKKGKRATRGKREKRQKEQDSEDDEDGEGSEDESGESETENESKSDL
jgi:hypothetical protein